MKKVIVSAGLLALGVAGMQVAQAQSTPGNDKPWSISGTLRGFYDDNYFTLPKSSNPPGGYGFEVGPSATFSHQDGPTSISAAYYYDLKYYGNRPSTKTDQEHHFEFALNHNFNEKNNIKVIEDFVDSQDPESLTGIGSATTAPLRSNSDNYHNTASIDYQVQVTHLLGFIFGYSNNWYDYTGNADQQAPGSATYAALLNRFEHNFTIDSTWMIDEETTAIFGYQFLYTQYTSNDSINGSALPYQSPNTRNNYTHSVYVGVNHSFTSQLRASVRGGIQDVIFYNSNPSQSDSLTPYANLSVSYDYMEGGTASLGFLHSHNATDVANIGGSVVQDQESSTVYATVSQVLKPISPNLTAIVTGSYQDSSYIGTGPIANESDNIYEADLDISYAFTKYLSTDFRYNYSLLQSDIQGRSYDRNQVSIGITATY